MKPATRFAIGLLLSVALSNVLANDFHTTQSATCPAAPFSSYLEAYRQSESLASTPLFSASNRASVWLALENACQQFVTAPIHKVYVELMTYGQAILKMSWTDRMDGFFGFCFILAFVSSRISLLAMVYRALKPLFGGSRQCFMNWLNFALFTARALIHRNVTIVFDLALLKVCRDIPSMSLLPFSMILFSMGYYKTYLFVLVLTLIWHLSERILIVQFGFSKMNALSSQGLLESKSTWSSAMRETYDNFVQFFKLDILYHYLCSWGLFTCISFVLALCSNALLACPDPNGRQRPTLYPFGLTELRDGSSGFYDSLWLIFWQSSPKFFVSMFGLGFFMILVLLFPFTVLACLSCIDRADDMIQTILRCRKMVHALSALTSVAILALYYPMQLVLCICMTACVLLCHRQAFVARAISYLRFLPELRERAENMAVIE